LVCQRFSPQEQHGCAAGGTTNVIASLLAGAEAGSNSQNTQALSDYQRECQLGAQQESVIERWAKAVGVWTDGVDEQLPKTLGEQIAEGGEAKVYDHGSTLIKSIGLLRHPYQYTRVKTRRYETYFEYSRCEVK
jgi:hypothetical protein